MRGQFYIWMQFDKTYNDRDRHDGVQWRCEIRLAKYTTIMWSHLIREIVG